MKLVMIWITGVNIGGERTRFRGSALRAGRAAGPRLR